METFTETIFSLSRGNPGGLSALADVSNTYGPKKAMEIAELLMQSGIYGDEIWILYKDAAECKVHDFVEIVETANSAAMDVLNEYRLNVGRRPTKWNHEKPTGNNDCPGADL